MGVGADAVFRMPFDDIRASLGKDKPTTAALASRFEKMATEHRMIDHEAAMRLLAKHGIDITDPAEIETSGSSSVILTPIPRS